MKHLNKIPLRNISVLGVKYLWKRGHYHLTDFELAECVEKVVIYCSGYKNSPLELHFRQEDNPKLTWTNAYLYWCVGYPDQGVIWRANSLAPWEEDASINLNRPAVVEAIIRHYVGKSWFPEQARKPLVITDALRLLEEIQFPLGI